MYVRASLGFGGMIVIPRNSYCISRLDIKSLYMPFSSLFLNPHECQNACLCPKNLTKTL